MQSMDAVLYDLFKKGLITKDRAQPTRSTRERLEKMIEAKA